MNRTLTISAACSAAVVIGLGLVPAAAHADAGDRMYRVGVDIQPGDYMYTVVGNGTGSWKLCSNANCEVGSGLINMDQIIGMGHTGYFTVTPSTKFVKTNDLQLTRAS